MGAWLAWLAKIGLSRKFVKWLVEELGPNALNLFGSWVSRVRHRQIAIDEADQIDGHFSAAIIDGERHLVVWKDGKPVSAYPPISSGDLKEKLRHHARKDLKDPEDLPTRHVRRWLASHIPGIGEKDPGVNEPTKTDPPEGS